MPWNATDTRKERTQFVLEWERRWDEAEGGAVNMAELCRMYGVSRQTGYTWVARYRDANHDVRAVAERSRRPKSFPTALSQEVEDVIVAARKRWPKWGPRKLRQRLIEAYPGVAVPSASVMSKVLKRRGMTVPRRRRRRRAPVGVSAPFTGCDEPNAVWCMDFKGWFQTHDAVRCYPFTLIDAFSRYLLRCEGLADPDTKHVRSVLDSAFLEFGLPAAIRSDGGPPFASTGPARLTELSVWLLKLGLRVEIIAPGKPQQNGRLERLHRTLKAETASPPEPDLPPSSAASTSGVESTTTSAPTTPSTCVARPASTPRPHGRIPIATSRFRTTPSPPASSASTSSDSSVGADARSSSAAP